MTLPRYTQHTLTRAALAAALGALLFGCGAEDASDPGGGGGNVGFGGAQDIGQFRAILDDGGIPGESTLDAGGFFAEHFTELPDPDCGQTLCAHAMLSVGNDWVVRDYQALLQISMNTPVDPEQLERLPLNLVVVVDESGSMASDGRLEKVKQGLHLLVDQLTPGDRLALVSYSTDARVRADFADELTNEQLHGIINQLSASGSTNIYDALSLGFQLSQSAFDPARQNRVILLSDGLATAGITDNASIEAVASGAIEAGIGLTTIGVGLEFNVDLMRGLAERGSGNFYFIEDADAATEVFVEELDYFMSPLALRVSLSLSPGQDYLVRSVSGTKLWKTEGQSGMVYLPAVFVASRTSNAPTPNGRRGGGSALFVELDIAQVGGEPGRAGTVTLSYTDAATGEELTQEVTVDNPLSPGDSPGQSVEDTYYSIAAMAENYAIYNIYRGLLEATREAESNYGCAMATLSSTRERAVAWNAGVEDPDIAADIDLIDQFTTNLAAAGGVPSTCDGGDGVWEDDPWSDQNPDQTEIVYACSATGAGGSPLLVFIGGALLLGLRRRRKA